MSVYEAQDNEERAMWYQVEQHFYDSSDETTVS